MTRIADHSPVLGTVVQTRIDADDTVLPIDASVPLALNPDGAFSIALSNTCATFLLVSWM